MRSVPHCSPGVHPGIGPSPGGRTSSIMEAGQRTDQSFKMGGGNPSQPPEPRELQGN
eukprot:CAMPEP_0171635462 /NCGR_PEP_ID=MMETSP0990-20121206/26687_1 /TAXON_ID=483369 /ORGANISM="non described non described, Strain CCMP2098" /LENGTH=56 /DNA_ID=CAMNT_0012207123 /DNA_START=774 /DNA_END=944 /DNA_ORIENTATION=+